MAKTEGKELAQSPHVVIIGAGFAGLNAAKVLGAASIPLHLTVVDRNNFHLFQPLLYQVATAGLSPADIATPVRTILRHAANTDVFMASVETVDVAARTITLDHGQVLGYDYLIVATGARHSYFNHPEWESLAPGLKTVDEATEIRRRVLLAFERAERSEDPVERQALLTFVIVGGGPTGIEMAGAIAELAEYALAKDFVHIRLEHTRVCLLEAGDKLLASFHPKTSANAEAQLKRLGIEVLLNTRVTAISPDGVSFGGKSIAARTVIWAAGVQPSPLGKALGVPLDKGGRVLVQPDLTIPGHPEVFVIGDLAAVPWEGHSTVPGMAPGAMQEGRYAARMILRKLRGKPTPPFRYVHKGSMATIGRGAAVVDVMRWQLSGAFAWLIWLSVHITYLIGFRNRVLVLFEWAWSFFTYQRGTRLITGAKKLL